MLIPDTSLFESFARAEIRAMDIDRSGRFGRDLSCNRGFIYALRQRLPPGVGRADIVSVHAARRTGDLHPCYFADTFGAAGGPEGEDKTGLCLIIPISGAIELTHGGEASAVQVAGTKGAVLRALAGMRYCSSDGNARLSFWIHAQRLERMLQALLHDVLNDELVFTASVDWAANHARAVSRLLSFFLTELSDPAGLASDPVALESFTDLLVQNVLSRLPHNYADRMTRPHATAIPAHLRRAEAFMQASADQPISMADVAAAAGCGLGTLNAAFRRFREATPLAALHAIRLERIREALLQGSEGYTAGSIARRFGFSNATRFAKAYGRRFGEHPSDTTRRSASR